MDKKITTQFLDELAEAVSDYNSDEFDIADIIDQYLHVDIQVIISSTAPFPIALTPCKHCVEALSKIVMTPIDSVDEFVKEWIETEDCFVMVINESLFKRMDNYDVARLIAYELGQVRFGKKYPEAIYSGIYETLSSIGSSAFKLFNYKKFKEYLGLAITVPTIGIPDTAPNEDIYDEDAIDISDLTSYKFMRPEFTKAEVYQTASRMSAQLFWVVEQIYKQVRYENSTFDEVVNALSEESVFSEIIQDMSEYVTESADVYPDRVKKGVDDYITEGYYTEFFALGKKSVPRIDPNDIDYISVMIDSIKTPNDKLMVLGYINSKVDIVEFYESILMDKRKSRKYSIPYTIDSIQALKKTLQTERQRALAHPIPKQMVGLNVSYPTGYEG